MRKAKVWDARQLPAYLTVAQYGELMGICPKTVRRMCQRGELPAHKEGPRLWRIDKNAGTAAGGHGDLPAERQEGSEKQKARRCWNTDELPSDRLKGLSPE